MRQNQINLNYYQIVSRIFYIYEKKVIKNGITIIVHTLL